MSVANITKEVPVKEVPVVEMCPFTDCEVTGSVMVFKIINKDGDRIIAIFSLVDKNVYRSFIMPAKMFPLELRDEIFQMDLHEYGEDAPYRWCLPDKSFPTQEDAWDNWKQSIKEISGNDFFADESFVSSVVNDPGELTDEEVNWVGCILSNAMSRATKPPKKSFFDILYRK